MVEIRRLQHGELPPEGVAPGRYIGSNGYARLRWRVGIGRLVECYEHRWVMGNPPADVEVHHVNGIRDDNRPENLRVVTPAEHKHEHRQLDRAEAARMYEAGASTPEIGAALGCDASTVYRALKDDGVATRSISESLRISSDRLPDDLVARLHGAGVRSRRIAEVFGVAPATIDDRVRSLGLTPHRPGRPSDAERQAAERAIRELIG